MRKLSLHKLPGRGLMIAVAGALLLGTAAPAARAAEEIELKQVNWPSHGMFGTFDRAALQRGFQIFQNVCQNCHHLKYLAFRNLEALGYNEAQIKTIAAGYQITDGPNDQGEMFQRAGRPSDFMPWTFPNEQAAAAANGGKAPPDLSLMVKAREGGQNYIYSVLTGYTDPPEGVQVPESSYYNQAYPGHNIAMPQPLQDDAVQYEDGTKATLDQEAKDVVQFLAWVAEPKLEQRKQMGLKAIIFLVVLTGLLYAYKRRVWADVH